jgi:hypothetical protein
MESHLGETKGCSGVTAVVVQVPIRSLANCSYWTEGEDAITREEIQRAVGNQDFHQEPIAEEWYEDGVRDKHIKRIAYLAVHGWDDAIEIDVGVPVLNYWNDHIVIDGNHRLAAAIFRGDETIGATIAGQLDYGHEC